MSGPQVKKSRESRLENQANLILTDSRIFLEHSNNILKFIQKFDMGTTVCEIPISFSGRHSSWQQRLKLCAPFTSDVRSIPFIFSNQNF